MIKTTKYLMLAASVALALVTQATFAVAQEAPQLTENQRSIALIDIRVDQLIKEAVASGIEQKAIDEIPLEGIEGVKASEIVRVFGAVCLPEDLEQVTDMMAGPPRDGLPMDFFLKIKFTNTEALEKMIGTLEENSETVTLDDGKEYLTPKGFESGLFFAHRADETTFEVGTKAYLVQPKRNFFTDQLMQAFKSAPKEPIRLVVDLETRRKLLQEAVAMGKENLDPVSSAYLDLIDNAKSLVITSSLGSKNLVSVIAEANNDSDAEELAEGINGLLGMGKVGFGAMYGQMVQQAPPEMKEPLGMVKGIVDTLAATQSQSTVTLYAKKPEGFSENMAKLQQGVAAQAVKVSRMNDFKQMALATHNYESAHMEFPFQKDAENAFSWRVKILPYMELNSISEEMDMSKTAKEAPNAQFAKKMPELYGPGGSNSGVSWIKSTVEGFGSITDGSSNTIMLIENPKGGPWMEDKPLTLDEAVKLVTGLADGETLIVAFYDGSVSRISNKVPEKDLRAFFDPADGNVTDDSWRY